MTARAALLLTVALGSAQVNSQEMLSPQQRIERLDVTLAEIRQHDAEMKTESNEAYRDLRGRTALDDIKQWAFPDSLVDSISELTEKARASAPDWDEDSLNLAESLMCIALARSEDLRAYWMAMPQISWRARWTAFAEANHLESDEIDPALLSEEQSLLAALESGRFTDASSHTKKLDELLATALTKSSGEIIRRRNPQDIVFVDRGTPCPVDKQRGDSPSAHLAVAANPEEWYPAGAKDRGESGSIVVRARIADSNCATAFAVLVSSGYPELDAAALKVAEASRYLAAVEAGKPVASELTFKVRFELEEEE